MEGMYVFNHLKIFVSSTLAKFLAKYFHGNTQDLYLRTFNLKYGKI